MELSRLLEITHDLKTCALCPDRDLIFKCSDCQKVNQITDQDLRLYYTRIMDIITENATLRRKLKIMQEEYLEICFGECDSCKFYVEPDVDDNNMPTEGYCSIRAELKE